MTSDDHKATWKTASAQETFALGEEIGRSLSGDLTMGLVGPLGAGKTLLTKGIAVGNGLGDPNMVTSPTFTLVHEYAGRIGLHHVDAYRLSGSTELAAIGFDELVESQAAVVVEWADRVRSIMPEDTLWIELAYTGLTTRAITATATGEASHRCLEAFEAAYR